ncbi:MAG: HAD-IIB family hydrolase, partial [Verrucomicrobiota bacterium]
AGFQANMTDTIHYILASDIDNTLTGDREALIRLAEALTDKMKSSELTLILSTGRRLEQILEGFREEDIPRPHGIVSQVGTEIYVPPFKSDSKPLNEWKERLLADFSRETAENFLTDIEGLEMQPDEFNTPLKVSCFLDKTPDPEAAAQRIRERAEPYKNSYQVVWSSGKDLDIIPTKAGKANAILFLREYLGLSQLPVVAAGDSGNDSSMFDTFKKGIIVGNAKPELIAAQQNRSDRTIYFAINNYAAGVYEGLRYFGILY